MVDFTQISSEDLEFLTEDILKSLGYVIDSRPARGPDQGKDMIAIRDSIDAVGFKESERMLIECKHFAVSKRSVLEADIGNFDFKMMQHHANRYLLVTSTAVSETVKNQLQAFTEYGGNNRKATFWGKQDLVAFLQQNAKLINKYFHSWEKESREAVAYVGGHFHQAHRGAILWSENVTAVFGNDGYSEKTTKVEIQKFREELSKRKIQEICMCVDEEEYTWVLLLQTQDAREMHELIWECAKPRFAGREYSLNNEINEAHKVLWTFWDRAHKKMIV